MNIQRLFILEDGHKKAKMIPFFDVSDSSFWNNFVKLLIAGSNRHIIN